MAMRFSTQYAHDSKNHSHPVHAAVSSFFAQSQKTAGPTDALTPCSQRERDARCIDACMRVTNQRPSLSV
jgi:hypothetical protein